jgi:hypothetical protein
MLPSKNASGRKSRDLTNKDWEKKEENQPNY